MTEYQKTKAVYDCWLCSLFVQVNIEKGTIPYTLFNEELPVFRGEGTIWKVNSSLNTLDNINRIANNLKSITLGSCFVQFDTSLDAVFGNKPKKFPREYLTIREGILRMIIYMMRCAFAHNPAMPIWEVRKDYVGVGILSIPKIFQIDPTGMDTKPLHQNQHGGTQPLLRLMNYCLNTIKESETSSEVV